MSPRRRLLVGLVVDGQLGSELDGLRRALRGPIGRIAPHITIIAPINIAEQDIERAQHTIAKVSENFRPFALTLGPGATFSPVTPVVYLEVASNLEVLSAIRAQLAEGVFAAPLGRNERPYVPHLTLGNRLGAKEVAAAMVLLSSYRIEVVFDRLVLFQQDDLSDGHPWQAFDEAPFEPRAIVGRGGRELVFSKTHQLNPIAQSFFDESWSRYSKTFGATASTDESFALCGQSEGRVIAVATGRITERVCIIEHLIVDETERANGVGTAVVLQTEDLARQKGCDLVRILCPASSPAATFFIGRGFRAVNELRSWNVGQDFVVFERSL